MTSDLDDECPGAGKCHGCQSWCADCGDVKHVCDARLRFERCDQHPIPPEWGELKRRRKEAERRRYETLCVMREVLTELDEITDLENARRAYGEQRAEEEQRFWDGAIGQREGG